MSSNALAPVTYLLQQSLRNVDLRSFSESFDLQYLLDSIDLKTFSWVALVVVGLIFVFDLFSSSFGSYGSYESYGSYGRTLAVSAADAWQTNKDQITFGTNGRGSRSLESVTEVLDALAEAVKKWEEPQDNADMNRSL